MDAQICAGQTDRHIEYRELQDHTGHKRPVGLQPEVWQAFERLKVDAADAGIDLQIASGFRDFDRQLAIWNAKAQGERAVLDTDGKRLQISDLSPRARCEAILRWSALPGASRHHWGTDLDVYDGATISADYQLQLVPQEYADDGPFARLSHWFNQQLLTGGGHGFFRPYLVDDGGIAPEAWHLSYAGLACDYQQYWSSQRLRQCLQDCDMQLKDTVINELQALYTRFVVVDLALYPSAAGDQS